MWFEQFRPAETKEMQQPPEFTRALAQIKGIEVDLNPVLEPQEQQALKAQHARWVRSEVWKQGTSQTERVTRQQASRPQRALHPYA